MLDNETLRTIAARRSIRLFTDRKVGRTPVPERARRRIHGRYPPELHRPSDQGAEQGLDTGGQAATRLKGERDIIIRGQVPFGTSTIDVELLDGTGFTASMRSLLSNRMVG